METASASIGRVRAPSWRAISHVLGNVFIGIALGLASYYLITDIVSGLRQDELRSELDALGPIAAPVPDAVLDDGLEPLDFSEWEELDVAYWNALEAGGVFGRLVIDRMELDTVVVKGHSREVLKKGPGWIDYTDLPGPTGNVGISGHRTTYGAPFRRLDEVLPGDTIDLYSPYRRYRYEVVSVFAVAPNRVDVVATTEEPMLTLTACHPPYSAAQRLIVQSKLVEVRRLDDTAARP